MYTVENKIEVNFLLKSIKETNPFSLVIKLHYSKKPNKPTQVVPTHIYWSANTLLKYPVSLK